MISIVKLEKDIVNKMHKVIVNLLCTSINKFAIVVNKIYLRSNWYDCFSIANCLKQVDKCYYLVGIFRNIGDS